MSSHESAAALHRLDGMPADPANIVVSCSVDSDIKIDGVESHRTRDFGDHDVITVDQIRCTTLARTLCDLAAVVDDEKLIRMLDDIQRRGSSLRWVQQTAERLRRRGRAGPKRVLDLIDARRHGYRVPDSWFEQLVKDCLASPILTGLVRQHSLRDERGHVVARFDLALPWARLGIEAHSREFHFGQLAEGYDEARDTAAAKLGWEIMYLGFAATRSPAAVCKDVEAVVVRRASDLGLSPPTVRSTA